MPAMLLHNGPKSIAPEGAPTKAAVGDAPAGVRRAWFYGRRRPVSGFCKATSTFWKTGTPWPCASIAQEAEGPSCVMAGMGSPRIARACKAN